ncbi:uncharacterized protein LOC112182567 [Rosa chinensis]|uniref:uncharacterized protein LOC112182567 n=1 Tax=Rosa chinensis TaxID=74649 RepID=UPI000D088064|nr:uncharacterized protein LOC112182567 [Rosa chinensis]
MEMVGLLVAKARSSSPCPSFLDLNSSRKSQRPSRFRSSSWRCKLQIFSGHKGNWVQGLSEEFKFVLSSFWIPLSISAGEGYEVPEREEYPSSLEKRVRDGDETRKVEGKKEDFSIWN